MANLLRWVIGAFAALFVGVLIVRCDPIPLPTEYSYLSHVRPRVFASHDPLIPQPGKTVTIRIEPDLDPASTATVQRAVAQLTETGITEQVCAAQPGGAFACTFTLGAAGAKVYSARLELSDGTRVHTQAAYRFTALATLPADELVDVRVPVSAPKGFRDTYRVDLAFVRDPENFGMDDFVLAARTATFAGILADPVYRWRDRHLGFYLHTRPGFVESYYTPRDTRCGRNPWPQDAALPARLAEMEVMGVLHRKAADSNGIEGSGVAPANVAFRDCAGRSVRRTALGTFSANAAIAAFPSIAKHEYGHAGFGLGDEYTEDDSTRNVPPPAPTPVSPCCCKVEESSGGTTTGGGSGTTTGDTGTVVVTPPGGGGGVGIPTAKLRCSGVGGITETTAGPADQTPLCTANPQFPPFCGANADSGCPSLAGNCVALAAWLGATPPANASTARPNVFESRQACEDARQKATDHPSVEDPARSLAACRQLCGGSLAACPCGGSEFWIVDHNPVAQAANAVDTMGVVSTTASQQGGTCQWCVETTLCLRWQGARGDNPADAWGVCEAPAKQAPQLQATQLGLVAWINAFIAWLQSVVIF